MILVSKLDVVAQTGSMNSLILIGKRIYKIDLEIQNEKNDILIVHK